MKTNQIKITSSKVKAKTRKLKSSWSIISPGCMVCDIEEKEKDRRYTTFICNDCTIKIFNNLDKVKGFIRKTDKLRNV